MAKRDSPSQIYEANLLSMPATELYKLYAEFNPDSLVFLDAVSKNPYKLLRGLVDCVIARKGYKDQSYQKTLGFFVSFVFQEGSDRPLLQGAKIVAKKIFLAMPRKELHALFDVMLTDSHFDTMTLDFVSTISTSLFPYPVQREFKKWHEQYAAARSVAPAIAEPKSDVITIVEVDDLLPSGATEALDIVHGLGGPSTDDPSTRTQPRLEWLIDALGADGVPKSAITLYTERSVEGRNPKVNPYIVLDVDHADRHIQIAVCQTIGHATFVIRTPFDPKMNIRTVADLKKDPTVFEVRCYSKAQWVRNIHHYTDTPLENLTVQLKTHIAWHNKKDALIDSIGAFHAETRQLPSTSDTSVIEQGTLAGLTTWRRAYNALCNGSIAGLEDVKNFPKVLELAQARAPVITIDARTLFLAAAQGMQVQNGIPETISGHAVSALNRAFKANAVTNLAEFVPEAKPVTCLTDFLIATGLAEERGSEIVVSSPNVIGMLLKLARPS